MSAARIGGEDSTAAGQSAASAFDPRAELRPDTQLAKAPARPKKSKKAKKAAAEATTLDTVERQPASVTRTRSATPPPEPAHGLTRALSLASTATIQAPQVHRPSVIADVQALLGLTRDLDIFLKAKLKPGPLGAVEVRPDTYAHLRFVTEGTRLVEEKTAVRFTKANGDEQTLDGPFGVIGDVRSIYLKNKAIHAGINWFTHPNLTRNLLGDGYDRVPASGPAVLQHFARKAGVPDQVQIGRDGEPTSATAGPSLTSVVDLASTEVSASGRLAKGKIQLGPDVEIQLADDAEIRFDGKLGHLKATVSARVENLRLGAGEGSFASGAGEVKLEIEMVPARTADGELDFGKPPRVLVRVVEANLRDVEVRAKPGANGEHHLQVRRLLVGAGSEIEYLGASGAVADASAGQLRVDLKDVDLIDASARLTVQGADGKPSIVALGRKHTGPASTPVRMQGSFRYDSAKDTMALDAKLSGFQMKTERLHLAGSKEVNVDLGVGTLSSDGPSRLRFESDAAKGSLLDLETTTEPWVFRGQFEDVRLGRRESAATMVDLSSESEGSVGARRLRIGSNTPPVVEGLTAKIDVVVDEVRIPLASRDGAGGGQREFFSLTERTRGTLEFSGRWNEAVPPPSEMTAKLRLSVGTQALVRTAQIEGLEGAKIEINAKTGEATIEVDVNVKVIDGVARLTSKAGVQLANTRINVDAVQGSLKKENLAPVRDPALPLEPLQPFALESMRPTATAATKPVSMNPDAVSIAASAHDGALSFTTPIPAATVRDIGYDFEGLRVVPENLFGIKNDVLGPQLRIERASLGQGALETQLVVEQGRLVPGKSSIKLVPPLELEVHATQFMMGAAAVSTPTVKVTVSELRLEPGPTPGTGKLVPVLLTSSRVLNEMRGALQARIGEALGTALIGAKHFDLDAGPIVASLHRRMSDTTPPAAPPAHPEAKARYTHSLEQGIAKLTSELRAGATRIQKSTVTLEAGPSGRIALGDGQFIETAPGTKLELRHEGDTLVVSGHAKLNKLRLGGPGQKVDASLDDVAGQLELRITPRADGGTDVRLSVEALEVGSFDVAHQLPHTHLQLKQAKHKAGSPPGRLSFSSIGGDSSMSFDLPRLEAKLALQRDVSADRPHWKGSRLDIREGEVRGHFKLEGERLTTQGTALLRNVRASLSGINEELGPEARLGLRQVDLAGDAHIALEGDGAFVLSSPPIAPGAKTPLRQLEIRGLSDSFDALTRGPKIAFRMKKDAQLTGSLKRLAVGGKEGVRLTMANARVDGEIEQGRVTVGPKDSAFEELPATGGRARFDIEYVDLSFPPPGRGKPTVALRAQLGLDVQLADKRERPKGATLEGDVGKLAMTSFEHKGLARLRSSLEIATGKDGKPEFAVDTSVLIPRAEATLGLEGEFPVEKIDKKIRDGAKAAKTH